jgi:tetratricopeptide (TPR) repeat protein
MKKNILYIFYICFYINITSAQSVQQFIQYGDEAYNSSNYFTAIDFYEQALIINNNILDVRFRLAESYRHVFNYVSAQEQYSIIIREDRNNNFPESRFFAAMMMKSNGQYQQAIDMLSSYIAHGAKNNVLVSAIRSELEILACKLAIDLKKNPIPAKVQNLRAINTPYSEFNPVPLGDKGLVFSVLKPVSQSFSTMIQAKEYLSNIYISHYGMQGLQKPEPFDATINSKDQHTANITFSHDGTQAYFNRCSYKDYKLRCDIWKSNLQTNNRWGKPVKLSNVVNSEEFTSTQPFLAHDKQTGNNILYFSSDRPGGIGGMDIWYTVIQNDVPQMPINLGSIINTPGDEITPFYDNTNGILYFSSDWHPGLGGYDIFKSKGGLSSWEQPKNIGYPINSGANDFNFYKEDDEVAYFVSNRTGSMTFKDQTCCNDIYIVDFEPQIIEEIIVEISDTIIPTVQQDILELLPLSLYFDNDHPNPRTMLAETKYSYKETILQYLNEKDTYIREYSKGLKEDRKQKAIKEMEAFFTEEVQAGIQKLDILSGLIYQDLQYGSNISIKVKGFTSPLTSAEYNYFLAKRRISSLVNYFKAYENGVLLPYIEHRAENGGSLTIIEEPAGEALANPYVSDNPLDRRQSVYSIAASKERRIEIFIYETDITYVNIDIEQAMIYISDNLIQLFDYIGIENKTIQINIANIGKETLLIEKIETSSDEIQIVSFPQELLPGEQGVLSFLITNAIPSAFSQHVLIHSNSVEKRNVIYVSSFKN